MNYDKTSDLLKALAHPVRLKIVEGLLSNECHVDKIVHKMGLPQSTISQHLAILKNRGILDIKKTGVKTCYRVVDKKIALLLKIFSKYQ
ncbi:MAG: transcriptional regulator [uncultured bacterium]|nr:MAG: transcriptional regulator [uncultured bacterium]